MTAPLTFQQPHPGGRILLMLGQHQVGEVFPPPIPDKGMAWRWTFWLNDACGGSGRIRRPRQVRTGGEGRDPGRGAGLAAEGGGGMMWPFHRHDFREHVRTTLDGATLGWGGEITPCYSITSRCRCGKEKTTHGWLLPLMPDPARDADGWPLQDGKRMPIAKRGKVA